MMSLMETKPARAADDPTDLEIAIAHIIRDVMTERDLTMTQLANMAVDPQSGRPVMSRSQLSRVYEGIKPMRMGQLFALCRVLGLAPSTVIALAEAQVNQR